jgi:signal transduction histidine kinase
MTSANRAAALTHRLLAFARRQPLVPKSVDANQLVVSLEDLLRRTIGVAIDLKIVASDDLWNTLCDPNQLESALLNLTINARDHQADRAGHRARAVDDLWLRAPIRLPRSSASRDAALRSGFISRGIKRLVQASRPRPR